MKRNLIVAVLGAMLAIGFLPAKSYADDVSFDVFYNSLSPYGEWVNANIGYAWRPYNVRYGWRPYLDGRWIWTDYGWYWSSYEPFGWATYHYGRWSYDDYYGWIWLPDNTWGPAWVDWRYNDDFIGWAPLPPAAIYTADVGIRFSTGWVAPVHYWNFVPARNFCAVRVVQYVQPPERVERFYGSTRENFAIHAEGGRVVNFGLDVNFVERRTNSRVNRITIVNSDRNDGEHFVREGGSERISVYHPQITGTPRNFGQQRGNNPTNNHGSQPNVRQEEQSRPTQHIQPMGRPYVAPDYRSTQQIQQNRQGKIQRGPQRVPQGPPRTINHPPVQKKQSGGHGNDRWD